MTAESSTAAFQEFQPRFDDYFKESPETPAEMYFLRYEAANQLCKLPGGECEVGKDCHQALIEHHLALDECQNYAVSKGVTSTYVLFNVAYYTKWLERNNLEDSMLNRAQWGREQIDRTVTTHPSDHATWYMVTSNPTWFQGMLYEKKHVVK